LGKKPWNRKCGFAEPSIDKVPAADNDAIAAFAPGSGMTRTPGLQ